MNGLYQIPGLSLTAFCHIIVIYNMAQHKYTKRKFIFYSCIYEVFFVVLSSYGYLTSGKVTLLVYAGIVAGTLYFSCRVSRDCFSKKCFLFISYFCLFSVLDNILKIMIKLTLPHISAPAGYYAAVILRSVLLMVLLALYKKYIMEIFYSIADISGRRWWNIALTALLFYVMQAAVSVLNAQTAIPPVFLLLLFAAISLIMCVVYGVIFSNIGYMKKEAQTALVRQNIEYLSAQLSAAGEAEERHRRLRHDVRHHLETIAEYAKAGDTDSVLAYIREYRVEVSETAVKQYSVNRTVNSILSVYAGKSAENGNSFTVRCRIPKELNVREVDLIALLGNLLENALHGCGESGKEQCRIDIHIRYQSGRLIVVCENTCSDELKLSDGFPSGKGIGISSILTVCRRYDGCLDYNIENGICSACAVLNL